MAEAPADPPGSKTVARQQGRTGNSEDPGDSSKAGVGRHNRHTGRKPDGPLEVRCLHMSEDTGKRPLSKGGHMASRTRWPRQPHAEVEPRRPPVSSLSPDGLAGSPGRG